MSADDRVDEMFAPSRSRLNLAVDRRAEASDRRGLRRDLATATANGAFALHYQPRLPLRPGRPAGAEALIRWPHRKRGLVPPAMFLPLADETGHILGIGGWALRAACRQAASWRGDPTISVNVSARQLLEGVLAGQVAAALAESGLPAERLELDLAEPMLVQADVEMILTLSAIRDLGVGLAVDDFGAEFGSLTMLKRLPLTAMKLDCSLTRGVPADPEEGAVLRGLVAVGHALGLLVIAEGVETEPQRAFLTAIGCDEAQGHLFSGALPPAGIGQLFASTG